MKRNLHHSASTLRFRRWSRVGYAIFCSLACSVSIGFLSVSVSSSFVQKPSTGSIDAHCLSLSEADPSDHTVDTLELLATLEIAQQLSLPKISFDPAAARCQVVYNFINCNG